MPPGASASLQSTPTRIRAALSASRRLAHEVLELDPARRQARKHAPLTLDLADIAKGYAVDRLAEVARGCGIPGALVGVDGELRAFGVKSDGSPWTVAVERPDHAARAPLSILALVATSGDDRHWVEVGGRRFSHTMDPRRGRPLAASPASVTVVAETCIAADAWATALMFMGSLEGADMAVASDFKPFSSIRSETDSARRPRVGCSNRLILGAPHE